MKEEGAGCCCQAVIEHRCQCCDTWRRRVRYQQYCWRSTTVLSLDDLNVESAFHQQMSCSLSSLPRTCRHDCQQSRVPDHRQESARSPETVCFDSISLAALFVISVMITQQTRTREL